MKLMPAQIMVAMQPFRVLGHMHAMQTEVPAPCIVPLPALGWGPLCKCGGGDSLGCMQACNCFMDAGLLKAGEALLQVMFLMCLWQRLQYWSSRW